MSTADKRFARFNHPRLGWATLALGWWLLATGTSVLWLQDWGAHGPVKAAHMGAEQAQAVWMSALAAIATASLLHLGLPAIIRGVSRWTLHTTPRQRWAVAVSLGLLLVLVVALLYLGWRTAMDSQGRVPTSSGLGPWLTDLNGGQRIRIELPAWLQTVFRSTGPALTSELLRWPACFLLALAIYRWQHAKLALPTQIMVAVAVFSGLGLGLLASDDKGPLLVATLAAVMLAAAAIRAQLVVKVSTWLAHALAQTALIGACLGILGLVPLLTNQRRLQAWTEPYTSPDAYLAEITWFLQEAGPHGFGAGQTPWCGYAGMLVNKCHGMPIQTGSDYTLAAIAGWAGASTAWALLAAVGMWCIALVRLASLASHNQHTIDARGLLATVGGLYALLMLAQTGVTALGNVGVVPLSGVNTPLLSWAKVNLFSCTLAMALVWPLPRFKQPGQSQHLPQPPALSQWWQHQAALLPPLLALLLAGVGWGLWQRYTTAAPDQHATGRPNPWLPITACAVWAGGSPSAALQVHGMQLPWRQDACPGPSQALPDNDPELAKALLAQLQRQPLAEEPLWVNGMAVPVRQTLPLSLDARLQNHTDQLGQCLTGQTPLSGSEACAALVPPKLMSTYRQRYEAAAVRSLSTLTLDLETGQVLTMSHQRSACSHAEMSGQPLPRHCPPQASYPKRRNARLMHQSLHAEDMAASTIKPLLAQAMLNMPAGQRWLMGRDSERMVDALARSDTAFFIDHLLCFAGSTGQPATPCPGINELRKLHARAALGQTLRPLPALTVAGLPMPLPAWPPQPTSQRGRQALQAATDCHHRPEETRWRSCNTEWLQTIVAPLWGQGEVRTNPLAIASLYLRLYAASQHRAAAPAPSLRQPAAHSTRAEAETTTSTVPTGFTPAGAQLILQGMQQSAVRGSAAAACRSVFDGGQDCMGLAIKTGTSLFPHANLTAQQRGELCRKAWQQPVNTGANGRSSHSKDQIACSFWPFKWAVVLDASQHRLTVVLAERNPHAATGRMDAADDKGPNVAVEAALLLHAKKP